MTAERGLFFSQTSNTVSWSKDGVLIQQALMTKSIFGRLDRRRSMEFPDMGKVS